MPTYLNTSQIVKTIGGLSIFSSGSTTLLPTSSNASTAAELTINVSSSLPTNIINNTVLNPYIRFTVISGSNRSDGINQDVAIRFFTQSHVQSKYTSSVATTTIGYVESSSLYLTSSANEEITFIDIKYSNPTNGISLGQAIHNALTGSTIFQEGLSASQTSTGKNHITTIHYNNFKGVVPSSTLELYTGSGEIPLSNNLSVSYSDTGSGALNFIPQPQLHFASASFHLRLNTTSPGDFEITQGVSSSGFIKSSNTNDRLLFFSGSGRIGLKTDDPQVDFDISAGETQFQVPGARKGLRINTEGNIESFNKEAASATTGSEFVLRYSRGSVITQTSMNRLFGAGTFSSNDEAQNFFNDLPDGKQAATLEKLERLGFNSIPDAGDVLGSIRFVAESGSTLVGEGFDDRITGEAASIQAQVHSVDSTGVRGDLVFNVADKTGRAVQRMVIDAGDEHQLSGSLNIGATDSEFAKIAMFGPEGNLQAGFFRVGASSADLKIGRMLLHDNGTQKVQLSAKGKSFIAGTSGTGTSGTFLGINTQNPTRALQVEGSISCSNNFFLDGEIKRVTNITASGDISASGTGSFTKLLVGGATAFNEGSTQIQANNGVIDAGNTGVFRGQRGKFNIITNRLNGQDIIEFTSANNVNILGPITASNISASGTITANSFVGNLTGQAATVATIAGLAPNTATTQATQPNITSLGTLTTLTVDDITINGSTISDGADLTIDAEGDITLDANGADVVLKDDGTEFGRFKRDSSDFVIKSATNNKDIVFRGVDNSATITALTLDMSEAGKAIFNSDISSSGTIIANKLEADQLVSHVGDANTGLQFASDTVVIEGNDVAIGTFATNRIELNKPITCSSSVSASGTITGLTGSFSALVGDTSQGTSLEVEGPITGSAFRGTKHVLRCETIYINDNPLVQNSVYFGNTLGNQPNNWNDPQAAGGAITSTSTISIAEDDMNWGYILPFDVSKVEVQCSLRPALGNGDDFTLAIYTAARQNDAASANMTITKVANSSGVTFSAAKYVTNDLTYTADLDKGSLIFVGIGSEDATDAKNARGLLNITVTAR